MDGRFFVRGAGGGGGGQAIGLACARMTTTCTPLLVLAALARCAGASCPVAPNTTAVIYHGDGATAECRQWEADFYAWLGLLAVPMTALELQSPGCGGRLLELGVQIFAMPGGNAYNLQASAGAAGKVHLLRFIDGGGLYVGTCAGAYYAAEGYFWQEGEAGGGMFRWSNLLGRFPMVEGSITDVWDDAVPPGYKLTPLDNGLHAIYWGGPTRGWRSTPSTGAPGTVLARFGAVAGGRLPAAWHVSDDGNGSRLLFSAHFEAEEGIGIYRTGLTAAMTLANWRYRASAIARAAHMPELLAALPEERAPPPAATLAKWMVPDGAQRPTSSHAPGRR